MPGPSAGHRPTGSSKSTTAAGRAPRQAPAVLAGNVVRLAGWLAGSEVECRGTPPRLGQSGAARLLECLYVCVSRLGAGLEYDQVAMISDIR